jgi:hypothetical protein
VKPLVEGQGSSPWIAGKRLLVYEAIKEHTRTNGDGTKYTEPHHHLSFVMKVFILTSLGTVC